MRWQNNWNVIWQRDEMNTNKEVEWRRFIVLFIYMLFIYMLYYILPVSSRHNEFMVGVILVLIRPSCKPAILSTSLNSQWLRSDSKNRGLGVCLHVGYQFLNLFHVAGIHRSILRWDHCHDPVTLLALDRSDGSRINIGGGLLNNMPSCWCWRCTAGSSRPLCVPWAMLRSACCPIKSVSLSSSSLLYLLLPISF